MRIWHYTTGHRFVEIVRSGEIIPATANVPAHERPVVWFSTDPHWEPTANKALKDNNDGSIRDLSREETATHDGGLVRIEVGPETAPYRWADYKRMSGIFAAEAAGLVKAARRAGSDPCHWRVSFESVPRAKWIGVQVWFKGQWISSEEAAEKWNTKNSGK